MPFDGKIDTRLEKIGILIELCERNLDRDQGSYATCLWSEAIKHPRLVELGIDGLRQERHPDYPVSYARSAKFFFGENIPVTDAYLLSFYRGCGVADAQACVAGHFLFGGRPKAEKREFLIETRDKLRD